MLYQKLKPYFEQSEFFKEIAKRLDESTSGDLFFNLNHSSKAAIIAHVFQHTGKSILFVSADDKMAEDYLDDFQLLVGQDNACFLPDFEVLPYEERSPHYTIRAQRIETLSRAVSSKPQIFSLPIRSLLRKITSRKIFESNLIHLEQGSEYKPDQLISKLVGLGYSNEYQVSRVGELARRGGIIDIFSPNLMHPVRVEYFGDEIDSIREFNVTTQRSIGTELKEITLIPSREFSIHDIEADEKLWERIHSDGFYEGIELDVPLLLPELQTFSDYFNIDDIILFFDEYQFFHTYLAEITDETNDLWAKTRQKQKRRIIPDPDQLFADDKFIKKLMKTHQHYFVSASYQTFDAAKTTLEAPIISQTNMHSDLNLLEQSLHQKLNDGYKIIIQSDNRSQSKRMRDLLPNYEERIEFIIGVFHRGWNLQDAKLAIFTDHEIFSRYKRKKHFTRFSREEALVDYEAMKPGDFIVHIDYGIGSYLGLKKVRVEGNEIECLTIAYAGNDTVYVPTYQLDLVSRYVSEEGFVPQIHKLGSKKWENTRSKARKQIELVVEDLVKLYAERRLRKGIAFDADNEWQKEMEDAFIYEDTPDQRKSTEDIKKDMESDAPMERLLCGDVGFGKTEVAIRAAFKAVVSGYQVAVLVPTTLLAEQHYHVFKERLAQYPVHVAMLSRFRTPANVKKDILKMREGKVDIVIGTHRLLSEDVKFKRLGLLIVDEEHRFGVKHKEKLRKLKANVDTLYMSATPIPRTMNMALSKLKEMSLIQTSPKARLPVRTIIVPFDEEIIKDAINREIDRGGQVFFVHNRVQTIDSMATDLKKLMPQVRFKVAHGQMPEKQLEAVMLEFAHHQFDVLIASTIIESGIDIPNANTMIVNRADMFGLAQLYQIRGRVGRSNRRAYAYLMIPRKLTEDSRRRLETLTEYDYLGAGYQIAMRDLELRGAGTLLGTKQSGVINSIGFNYYNRLLEQAVENMEKENPAGLWDDDQPQEETRIRLEADFYFPSDYIANEEVRLQVYRRMQKFDKPEEFDSLSEELKDRFGELPKPAIRALRFYRLRLMAKHCGLSTLHFKRDDIVLEFDQKRLPARDKIARVVSEFKFPVRFDTTGGLKIFFTVQTEPDYRQEQQTEIAENILKFFAG